eukprot:60921-Pleurochrysis_carterae.AAC.4
MLAEIPRCVHAHTRSHECKCVRAWVCACVRARMREYVCACVGGGGADGRAGVRAGACANACVCGRVRRTRARNFMNNNVNTSARERVGMRMDAVVVHT